MPLGGIEPSRQKFAPPPAANPLDNSKTSSASSNPLTRREQEILALIAAGKTNQEIAEQLYIAIGTVRVHVHAILQKLEVRDCANAHATRSHPLPQFWPSKKD